MSDTKTKNSTYQQIWAAVDAIPNGRVSTYGRIAEYAGLPGRARMVGYSLHALPEESSVPWHRVVNASGGISLPAGDGGFEEQCNRLVAEGIEVTGGKVDLKKFCWPNDSDLG